MTRREEERTQDRALAQDMDDAEKPYRHRVSERNRGASSLLAKEAADMALRSVDGAGDITPDELAESKLHEIVVQGLVGRANRVDMAHAAGSAETARQQHKA